MNVDTRRILYVSGSRADYGPIRNTLRTIANHPQLSLEVLATGMHLEAKHGVTVDEIVEDGFDVTARVDWNLKDDSLASMAKAVGTVLHGMSNEIDRLAPDIVLLLGDRAEQLAAAVAAAIQNCAIAHLCGGSLSGSIDDSFRHAITKFSHLHLPALEEHADRIIQMGEDPKTVHVVGYPGGDLRPDVTYSALQVREMFGLSADQPYLLVVQHPVTQSTDQVRQQISATLDAVAASGMPALLANPNSDAGGRVIQKVMAEYAQQHVSLNVLQPPRSREVFASVMAHSAALIGNSSSAVSEAMSVGLPVVNIGDRQQGREHHSCWINVSYEPGEIAEAIEMALNDPEYRVRLEEVSRVVAAREHGGRVAQLLRDFDISRAQTPKSFFPTIS